MYSCCAEHALLDSFSEFCWRVTLPDLGNFGVQRGCGSGSGNFATGCNSMTVTSRGTSHGMSVQSAQTNSLPREQFNALSSASISPDGWGWGKPFSFISSGGRDATDRHLWATQSEPSPGPTYDRDGHVLATRIV
jgi:hypothetical protein